MTIKTAVTRDEKTFANRYTYRELTYKLASRIVEGDDVSDPEWLFHTLAQEATTVPPANHNDMIDGVIARLGLTDHNLSKVETFLIPETLNTAVRGIATKDDKEIRFYIERP